MTDVGVIDGKYVVGLLRTWSQWREESEHFNRTRTPKSIQPNPQTPTNIVDRAFDKACKR